MNFYYQQLNTDVQYRSRLDAFQSDNLVQAHDLKFCIPFIDNYQFGRKFVNFDTTTNEFLCRLRNKYKKINLWYSGGVDSHYLLSSFIKHNIPLDEITICKKLPFGDHSYSMITAEELYTAIPYINTATAAVDYIKHHQTKLSTLTIGAREYKNFFRSPSWINNTNIGEIRSPTFISNVFKLIPDIDVSTSTCNLLGSETPFVYYNNGWKFYFVDWQFNAETHQSIVKPATSDPLFLESYVNAIIDQLEKNPEFDKKFSREFNRSVSSKFFTRLVPELQQVNSSIWAQYPNVSFDCDHTDIKQLINSATFKSWIDYRSGLELAPSWFNDYYYNTDWAILERNFNFGGVLTKEFVVN